jgi:hypothetical protein
MRHYKEESLTWSFNRHAMARMGAYAYLVWIYCVRARSALAMHRPRLSNFKFVYAVCAFTYVHTYCIWNFKLHCASVLVLLYLISGSKTEDQWQADDTGPKKALKLWPGTKHSHRLHIIPGKLYSLLVVSAIHYAPPLTKETYYKQTKIVVGIAIIVAIPRSLIVQCNSINACNSLVAA